MYISDQELQPKKLFSNAGELPVENITPPSKIRKTKDSKQDCIPGVATKTSYTVKTDSQLPTQKGSSWRRYREIMSLLDLGDKVLVASKRDAPTHRVGIRRFSHEERHGTYIIAHATAATLKYCGSACDIFWPKDPIRRL
jgi:hypothetical protein